MNNHYPHIEANPNFANIEQQVLDFWQSEQVFKQSIDQRHATIDEKNNEFIFYDGPPFANGLPHFGHLLTGYIKDVFARYQTLKGRKVERRFGWDCHGLPAEMGAEKDLKISGRMQIMSYGIDKFNDYCRSSVLKYTDEWEQYVTRQARWVDFKNSYKTMDLPYMESVMWAFKQLYNKGYIYESMRVMPYSWACETPLSNFETRLDNSYRERADKAVTVMFELKGKPNTAPGGYKSYKILVWTTTPWTLPSNLALAVGADIDYVAIEKNQQLLIIAKSLIGNYAKDLNYTDVQQIICHFKGSELVNLEYIPLFDYFKDHHNSFKILAGDFVTEQDGTGIVHLAPGFGEEDQQLCSQHNIELICPVDSGGKFTTEVTDFANQQVFEAIDAIIIKLKNNNNWLRTEQFLHNYPHCWRTDTPLIYKAVPSWYVEVTKFKDKMVQNNQQINWIPGHIKAGLFGKWLENARDWSISRNRFWGTPIPIWRSDDPKYPRIDVYGSIAELEHDFGTKITDLHKPYIDELVRANPDDPTGKSMMRRVSDVFDCWFESGSMPYAQAHYPFENKDWFEQHFPADFIVEYAAQTRGWFYTLMVLSTALFDRPPFLNCICHGVILDEQGQKLSKRLNNYADPLELFKTYSADALRFLMLSAPIMRGQELLIDKEGKMVRDTLRLSIKPIWNAYNFFTLYANIDQIKAEFDLSSSNLMDQYILAKAKLAIENIDQAMTNYDTISACQAVEGFFENLTNWYIRRNRNRFWKAEHDLDKQSAYNSLYSVLHLMCRAVSPLLPMLSEEIYLGLVNQGNKTKEHSVHLADWPEVENMQNHSELINNFDRVRNICSAALAIRSSENIRIRQPLAKISVLGQNITHLEPFSDIIKDEINVKEIIFSDQLKEQAILKLQINFPVIGKRLPTKVKEIIMANKSNSWKVNSQNLIEIANEVLTNDECKLILEPKEKKGSHALSSNDAMIIIDLDINEELQLEGLARDLVRFIQQARKDQNLNVTDRIELYVDASSKINQAIALFKDYIQTQTLSLINDESTNMSHNMKGQIENEPIVIKFKVVA